MAAQLRATALVLDPRHLEHLLEGAHPAHDVGQVQAVFDADGEHHHRQARVLLFGADALNVGAGGCYGVGQLGEDP